MKENMISRREFTRNVIGTAGAVATVGMVHSADCCAGNASGKDVGLRDKIFGCIAGSRMGSAFGAPVENWSVEKVKTTYGVLKEFQS